jgi:hypothetical protein
VEPVTKGIRIVLQFDVEVSGSDHEDEDKSELFLNIRRAMSWRKSCQKSSGPLTADDDRIKEVIDIIKEGVGKTKEVAFAMQYLYRKSSILPEYLKGVDAQLYHALVDSGFDVTLKPIVLHSRSDMEGNYDLVVATSYPEPAQGSDSESDSDSDPDSYYYDDGKRVTKGTFHLPSLCAIRQISSQHYAEYTGNEAQLGEQKYFGGGMFVSQKKAANVEALQCS